MRTVVSAAFPFGSFRVRSKTISFAFSLMILKPRFLLADVSSYQKSSITYWRTSRCGCFCPLNQRSYGGCLG